MCDDDAAGWGASSLLSASCHSLRPPQPWRGHVRLQAFNTYRLSRDAVARGAMPPEEEATPLGLSCRYSGLSPPCSRLSPPCSRLSPPCSRLSPRWSCSVRPARATVCRGQPWVTRGAGAHARRGGRLGRLGSSGRSLPPSSRCTEPLHPMSLSRPHPCPGFSASRPPAGWSRRYAPWLARPPCTRRHIPLP